MIAAATQLRDKVLIKKIKANVKVTHIKLPLLFNHFTKSCTSHLKGPMYNEIKQEEL